MLSPVVEAVRLEVVILEESSGERTFEPVDSPGCKGGGFPSPLVATGGTTACAQGHLDGLVAQAIDGLLGLDKESRAGRENWSGC